MKILVASLCGLGDFLLFLPALSLLKKRHPSAQVDLLTFPNGVQELPRPDKDIGEIFVLPYRKYTKDRNFFEAGEDVVRSVNLFLKLRKRRYDLIIWPFAHTTAQKRFIAWILGGGLRLMHRGPGFFSGRAWFRKDLLVDIPPATHRIDRNIQLLAALGIHEETSPPISLDFSHEELQQARDWIARQEMGRKGIRLGMQPGGNLKFNQYRQWPPRRYAELADRLSEAEGYVPYLFGAESERPLLEEIAAQARCKPLLVCGLHLRQAFAVALQMDLFIGNDSSLLHLTAAQGIRTVAVAGPSNPYTNGPVGPQAQIIRLDLPCSPCYPDGFSIRCPHHVCMAKFSTNMLFAALREEGHRKRVVDISVSLSDFPELTSSFMEERSRWRAPEAERMPQ